ncbi:MAG: pseudaminic acid cytidylyltransferase [Bacteroidia bacterium]|nr:pseudaminic acid cytidylyltransferase [Bacteroidia bacterium]
MEKTLVIIPARGGSKRIPRKNIKLFLGKPIIQYSIEAALNSNCFDEVMVSTDDKEIAEKSIELGAKVPFIRTDKNSNDFSTTADVIEEVIEQYQLNGLKFKYVCCIYPTAPFITADKLQQALQIIKTQNATSVVSVVKYSFPILRSFNLKEGYLNLNWPEYANKRSQDLPTAYHDAGQFYFLRVDDFMKSKKIFTEKTLGFELPETEVQDIDTEDDWKLAEIKYTFLNSGKSS